MCLCISVIKILCSPETQGKGPRLSLSCAHMHGNKKTIQKPGTERGSQATTYTSREEIVNTVFLFGGSFGVHLFASQTQTNFCTTYIHSIQAHQNDTENRKARVATCLNNCYLKLFSHRIWYNSTIIRAYLTKLLEQPVIIYGVVKTE